MQSEDTPKGFALGLTAYFLWGFLPLYMKAVAHIPAVEIIAHRVIWSIPVAGAVLVWLGRTADLKAALRSPRTIGMAAMTAALISVNWGIYVWSIASGHALEAALGYYINPLFSVFLGAVLLGEKLRPVQWAAIGLSAAAVLVLTVENGRIPYVGLSLTLTWGIYAYLKKSLPVGPNQGFLLEVLMLAPPALVYILWLAAEGTGHFLVGVPSDTWLILGLGLVTAGPLMIYGNAAKLLRLSTIGVMQYIAPTMIMLIAVFLFDEPFGHARAIAFPMIWAALALYTWSMLRARRG